MARRTGPVVDVRSNVDKAANKHFIRNGIDYGHQGAYRTALAMERGAMTRTQRVRAITKERELIDRYTRSMDLTPLQRSRLAAAVLERRRSVTPGVAPSQEYLNSLPSVLRRALSTDSPGAYG